MKKSTLPAAYAQFMKAHAVKKDPQATNTRIGSSEHGVYGGTYRIPDDIYNTEFLRLYHQHVFMHQQPEYLTEKQLDQRGPILVDIDLRYGLEVTRRLHTAEHIHDLITLYLDELQQMYQMDDDTPHIPVFVMEKPGVRRIEDKGIVKDGLHLIIGIQADRTAQVLLRARVLAKIAAVWSDLPIANTWAEVFDEGISRGHTNWQLYGSSKPGCDAYRLTHAYDVYVEQTDDISNGERGGDVVMDAVDGAAAIYETEQRLYELSARYPHHPTLFMTSAFREEYGRATTASAPPSTTPTTAPRPGTAASSGYGHVECIPLEELLHISNHDELAAALQNFLDSIEPQDYELREAYEYAMVLPKSYYGPGSFTQWIRVGWTLRNISPRLFVVWIAFSAQSDDFCFSTISTDLWERWQKFDLNHPNGLTKKSLIFWARQDNPEAYERVRNRSVEFYIDSTLDNANLNSSGTSDRAKGCGDYDIATVLYHLFKNEYVCVSVKANIWYRFRNHKWSEIDSGTTLRRAISEELRAAYIAKSRKLRSELIRMREAANLAAAANSTATTSAPAPVALPPPPPAPSAPQPNAASDLTSRLKFMQQRMETVCSIIERLAKTSEKKNIMTEAKELFFDGQFLERLDTNPYLLCFNNGVIDFKHKIFRKGIPEDCVSKTTNIHYVPLDATKHGKIVAEIEDFMHKLFPCPELHTYMWEHLASTLIGVGLNQTFNMYIGIGQNGKSVLVNLMEHVLGEYKGDVPLTMLTQQRTKVGGLAPELVQLKGVRYAVMQEPSKGDRINEGIMKQVTGGDPIQARAPYMPQTLSFIPQFKLIVCSNEFMEIRSNDHGTWRRVRVVDFESLFTEKPRTDDPHKPHQFLLDKKLKERFPEWAPIFASMLVERAFVTGGNVTDCEKVMSSSNKYREREDYISEFLRDVVEPSATETVDKARLRNEFREWFAHTQGGNYKSKLFNDVVTEMERRYGKLEGTEFRGCVFKKKSANSMAYSDNASVITGTSATVHGNAAPEEIAFEEIS
jgi:P4 family phage/plasmid primase-like protien